MKRLLALMGFFPLVWVEYWERAELVRAYVLPCSGKWVVTCAKAGPLLMSPDGTARTNGCTKALWREWERNRKHVTFDPTTTLK